MSSIAFEIVLVLLLLVANGIFSGSEIAIVSARKVRLEQKANRGDRSALAALKLANSPNNFLSAVQIGITLIGILSGTVGGATLSTRLQPVFDQIPALAPYSELLSIGLVVTLITYLSLVIGELVPKRIALSNPEQIACTVANPMNWLAKLTAPIVDLLGISTEAVLKLLNVRSAEEQPVTEEEIKLLIAQGAKAGMFEVVEQEMVSRVFQLGDRSIQAIMTPRLEIVWLDVNSPASENQHQMRTSPYSRFPVADDDLDRCLGVVSIKAVWEADLAGETLDLRSVLQPAVFVHENTSALSVLETFRRSGNQIALVTNEYGAIEGLVTLSDLMAAIVGELTQDEADERQIVRRDDGSYLLDGLLGVAELKALLNWESLPNEAEDRYHTLGGLVVNQLGKIPTAGDYFEIQGWQFEIVDMDGNRVDKVLAVFKHQES